MPNVNKLKVGIIGTGNIGSDLLMKVMRSPLLTCGIFTGRGESVDLRTIAKKVLRETGAKVPVLVQTPGRAKEYTCKAARLKKALPNFTYTPLDIAIAKLAAYYKSILPTIDRELLARDV